jgi:hypothetical protein
MTHVVLTTVRQVRMHAPEELAQEAMSGSVQISTHKRACDRLRHKLLERSFNDEVYLRKFAFPNVKPNSLSWVPDGADTISK